MKGWGENCSWPVKETEAAARAGRGMGLPVPHHLLEGIDQSISPSAPDHAAISPQIAFWPHGLFSLSHFPGLTTWRNQQPSPITGHPSSPIIHPQSHYTLPITLPAHLYLHLHLRILFCHPSIHLYISINPTPRDPLCSMSTHSHTHVLHQITPYGTSSDSFVFNSCV